MSFKVFAFFYDFRVFRELWSKTYGSGATSGSRIVFSALKSVRKAENLRRLISVTHLKSARNRLPGQLRIFGMVSSTQKRTGLGALPVPDRVTRHFWLSKSAKISGGSSLQLI